MFEEFFQLLKATNYEQWTCIWSAEQKNLIISENVHLVFIFPIDQMSADFPLGQFIFKLKFPRKISPRSTKKCQVSNWILWNEISNEILIMKIFVLSSFLSLKSFNLLRLTRWNSILLSVTKKCPRFSCFQEIQNCEQSPSLSFYFTANMTTSTPTTATLVQVMFSLERKKLLPTARSANWLETFLYISKLIAFPTFPLQTDFYQSTVCLLKFFSYRKHDVINKFPPESL